MTCPPSSPPSPGSSSPSPGSWQRSDVQALHEALVLGAELLVHVAVIEGTRPSAAIAMRTVRTLEFAAADLLAFAASAGLHLHLPRDEALPVPGPADAQSGTDALT